MLINKNYSRKGQSLIEVLIVVTITAIALTAILATGTSSISFGDQSGQRLLATNLAREGIEIVRAIRTSNWLSPTQSWPHGLTNDSWLVNYDSLSLSSAADNADIQSCTNCWLCQQTNEQYLHCSTSETYKRIVTISDGDLSQEKKIVSTVWWQERRQHTISLEVRLTNWR